MRQEANISIILDQSYPMETWEEIEDEIAAALRAYGVRGTILNEATGNTTVIKPRA